MRYTLSVWLLAFAFGCSQAAPLTYQGRHQTLAHSANAPDQPARADHYSTAAHGEVLLGDSDPDVERALSRACANAGLAADKRLAELSLAVARASDQGQLAPHGAFVSFHAQRLGLVEPTPQVWLASASQPVHLIQSIEAAVQEAAQGSRLTHCGGAMLRMQGRTVLALALSGRFLSLERPVPRRVETAHTLTLEARLAAGYQQPSLALTGPDGQVRRLSPGSGRHLSQALKLESPGEYTVEILAQGPEGMAVLAVFPVLVGDVPEPSPPAYAEPEGEGSAAEVAQNLAVLIAKERKKHNLPPLEIDARLEQVAFGHSQDMVTHGFVAHTSPRTGEASDRLARAGLRASVLLENIGRGYSAAEIHQGLMDSPGHRGNILHAEVRALGIGVVAIPEGPRTAFLVTQMMASFSAPRSAEGAKSALLQALQNERAQRKLGRVTLDAALSREAQRAAERYARGEQPDQRQLLQETTSRLRKPPRGVQHLGATLALTEETEPLSNAVQLMDPKLRALGVGLAQLAAGAQHRYVVVMILGTGS